MLSKQLTRRSFGKDSDFQWRGGEITRIEGLSDCVFAFAVTLFVVSLEVPKTFNEFVQAIAGFPVFLVCFAHLMLVWYQQYIYFRRYGLEDFFTLIVTLGILALTLFYVYPLKFLWTILLGSLLNIGDSRRVAIASITDNQVPTLMMIYAAGLIAVFSLFYLLYWHAYRNRHLLELSEHEILETKESMYGNGINVGVGVLSFGLAAMGPEYSMYSGLIYSTIGFFHWLLDSKLRKNKALLEAKLAAQTAELQAGTL